MEETKKKKKQQDKTLLGETNVKPSGQVIFPSLKEPAAEGVETWRRSWQRQREISAGLNTELLLKTPPLVKRPPEDESFSARFFPSEKSRDSQ